MERLGPSPHCFFLRRGWAPSVPLHLQDSDAAIRSNFRSLSDRLSPNAPSLAPWEVAVMHIPRDVSTSTDPVGRPTESSSLVLEAWVEGYLLGALIIMACVTLANMRRRVLLHKLILLELLLCLWSGVAIYFRDPAWGWYISATGLLMYVSYTLHNVISWMKSKPFLGPRSSKFYIWTVILVQPFWVVNAYANFAFFSNTNKMFAKTRPLEALFRDPWWVFTVLQLFWNVKTRYEFGILEMLRISPRFVVLLVAMCLSIAFLLLDILSVVSVLQSAMPTGINPFWKLAFSFKCLTDTVILDDFKTALDKMHEIKMRGLVGAEMAMAAPPDLRHHPDPLRKDTLDQPPGQPKLRPTAEHVDRL